MAKIKCNECGSEIENGKVGAGDVYIAEDVDTGRRVTVNIHIVAPEIDWAQVSEELIDAISRAGDKESN